MSESSLETSVAWMLDRIRISDLLFSFAAALDTKDWQRYVDNFALDGYVELPDPQSDAGGTIRMKRERMLELLPRSLGRYTATHHISANHQIQIAGDRAESRSYLQAVHVAGKATEHWSAGGWYDSRYLRSPGGWKFTHVKLTAVWAAGEVGAIRPE